MLVERPEIIDCVSISKITKIKDSRLQHSTCGYEPSKASCRECPTAEPCNDDLITWLVLIHNELVAVLDLIKETNAKQTSRDLFKARSADTGKVARNLRWAIVFVSHSIQLVHVRIGPGLFFTGFVPRTVQTNKDAFHERELCVVWESLWNAQNMEFRSTKREDLVGRPTKANG